MSLVLARRIGQKTSIGDKIIITLEDIQNGEILLDVFSVTRLRIDEAAGIKVVSETKFWLSQFSTLTINKYYRIRYNKLQGTQVAYLGFEIPKNIKVERLERYDKNVDRCPAPDRAIGNEIDESGRVESGDSGILPEDGCSQRDVPVQPDTET